MRGWSQRLREAASRLRAARATSPSFRCGGCRHFHDDRARIEADLPGLLVLSSAFGDSWGDAGLCQRHEMMLQPEDSCRDFSPRP